MVVLPQPSFFQKLLQILARVEVRVQSLLFALLQPVCHGQTPLAVHTRRQDFVRCRPWAGHDVEKLCGQGWGRKMAARATAVVGELRIEAQLTVAPH